VEVDDFTSHETFFEVASPKVTLSEEEYFANMVKFDSKQGHPSRRTRRRAWVTTLGTFCVETRNVISFIFVLLIVLPVD
jgi:hypothetical protein